MSWLLSYFQVYHERLELEILFLVSRDVTYDFDQETMWMVLDGKGIEMLTYVVILLLYITIRYRLKLKVRNFFVLIQVLCVYMYYRNGKQESGWTFVWDHPFSMNANLSEKLFLTPLYAHIRERIKG